MGGGLLVALLALGSCTTGSFSWERHTMKGTRTGVQASSAKDVAQKMGTYKDGVYTSPNGRVFSEGATPKAAKLMLDAQPIMADVKTVVGYCPEGMVRKYPECELSDWFIDVLMAAAEKKAGKKGSFGLTNFGGIRVDMPQGDVWKDDIFSMFPFRNNLCYLEIPGWGIRKILDQLAATSWQVVGGGKFVVQDKKLVSAEIGGEPLDDNKTYGVATISFLLNGGDGLNMAADATHVTIFPEYILDVMYPYVLELTAAGKPIEYRKDGRIKFLSSDGKDITSTLE